MLNKNLLLTIKLKLHDKNKSDNLFEKAIIHHGYPKRLSKYDEI